MMFNTPRKSDWTGNNLGTLATEHVDGATATHQNDQATGQDQRGDTSATCQRQVVPTVVLSIRHRRGGQSDRLVAALVHLEEERAIRCWLPRSSSR